MNKISIFFCLIFFQFNSFNSLAQENNHITLLPIWKINETKSYYITKKTIGYVDDRISSIEYDIDVKLVKVTGLNSEFTMMTIMMKDPVFMALSIIPNIRKHYKDTLVGIELVINKRANEFHISNVQELYDKIDTQLLEIYSHRNDFTLAQTEALDLIVPIIQKSFDKYEDIQTLYLGDMDFLLSPFKYNLPLNDTLRFNEELINPINNKNKVAKEVKIYLSNVTDDSLTIHKLVELNMKEMKNLMKSLIKKMSKTQTFNDVNTRKEIKALNETNIGRIEKCELNFDLKAGWTKSYRQVIDFYSSDNIVKKVSQIETTVLLKEKENIDQ